MDRAPAPVLLIVDKDITDRARAGKPDGGGARIATVDLRDLGDLSQEMKATVVPLGFAPLDHGRVARAEVERADPLPAAEGADVLNVQPEVARDREPLAPGARGGRRLE